MAEPSKTHAPFGLRRRGAVCFVAAARRCAPTSPAPPRLASGPPALATRPFVLSPRTASSRGGTEPMMSRRFKPIAALVVTMLAAGAGLRARSTGAREWRTASYLDFAEGSCADGGANTYVAADGTVRLINLWD